ncbi:hypothetical protein BJ875DRAFT_480096 [Amylocarpus encephaloides]|uniref:Uncharacterized protein n=1 Tax=Amylocarpus encephaloides TaxID=45428 RepID=A0A9P7YSC3_9HELO|nr:hypothetical protein BJ875DRAFT_480096 [Amylocarpus encephaloides]
MVGRPPRLSERNVDADGCYRSGLPVQIVQEARKAHAKQVIQQATASLSMTGLTCLFTAYTARCFEIQGLLNPTDFAVLAFLLSIACFWRSFHAKFGHTYSQITQSLSYTTMSISISASLTYYCDKVLDSIESYSLTFYCLFATIAAMAAAIVALMHIYDLLFVYSSVSCEGKQFPCEIASSVDRRFNPSIILLSVLATFSTCSITGIPLTALQIEGSPYDLEALENAMWRMRTFVVVFTISAIIVELFNILNRRDDAWLSASMVNSIWAIVLAWQSTQCIITIEQLDSGVRFHDHPLIRFRMLSTSCIVLCTGGISILASITRFRPRPAIGLRCAPEFLECPLGWRSVPRQVLTDDMLVSILRMTGLTEKERDNIVSALYHLPADATEDQEPMSDLYGNDERKGSVEEDKNYSMEEGHLVPPSGSIDLEMGLRVPPV